MTSSHGDDGHEHRRRVGQEHLGARPVLPRDAADAVGDRVDGAARVGRRVRDYDAHGAAEELLRGEGRDALRRRR